MDLNNEENYFTKRQNGSITDKDVQKHINNLQKYIDEDHIGIDYNKAESDFDKFCYEHCKDIEYLIYELKYQKDDAQKSIELLYEDYQDIGKQYFDLQERLEYKIHQLKEISSFVKTGKDSKSKIQAELLDNVIKALEEDVLKEGEGNE